MVSWSAFLQSFCQTFVAQEEKYQQRYLTSFKLALQIEDFHYWNWELMLNIFCRICGSLLRPFFWVWRGCFHVCVCRNCCAGQGHGWWLVPIINSCLGEMEEQDEHIWLFSSVFQDSYQSGTWRALVLTNVASMYLIILKGFLSRDSCLCLKTHTSLVPFAVTLSMSSMAQLVNCLVSCLILLLSTWFLLGFLYMKREWSNHPWSFSICHHDYRTHFLA